MTTPSLLDRAMKPALYFSTGYNAFGGLSFAFPEYAQRLSEIPDGHPFYRAFTVMTIAAFGVGYWWQAYSGQRDRTFLAVAAAGKLGFFFIHFGLWLNGLSQSMAVAAAFGDLILGTLFVAWLVASRHSAGFDDSRHRLLG